MSPKLTIVAKIGTSSLTDSGGVIAADAIESVCLQVAELRSRGDDVIVVTSAAVAAGLEALGFIGRPSDILTLQAVSAVGQSRLMRAWDDAFARVGLVSGQVLVTPNEFFDRRQYLHIRDTLQRMLALGVVPVINENDAVADDELRFGDNDRIAALIAHLIDADVMVLLTDTSGLFTADPRTDPDARLIEYVASVTPELEAAAGSAGTARGSGGMSSKLRAAKIASFSGIRAVIAGARQPGALVDAVDGVPGIGTVVAPQARQLTARKLWIGFAGDERGMFVVDEGAKRALIQRGASLLPAGVLEVSGDADEGDIVSISGPDHRPFARGVSRVNAEVARRSKGRRSSELAAEGSTVFVHADDLVLLARPARGDHEKPVPSEH